MDQEQDGTGVHMFFCTSWIKLFLVHCRILFFQHNLDTVIYFAKSIFTILSGRDRLGGWGTLNEGSLEISTKSTFRPKTRYFEGLETF